MHHIVRDPADIAYSFAVIAGITTKMLTNSWTYGALLFLLGFVTGVYVTFHIQKKARKSEKG